MRIAQSRGLPVAIYRPSRLSGDSRTGAMSHRDGFWHYVRACVELRAMPSDANAEVNLVPVDFAARAFTRLAGTTQPDGQAYSITSPHSTDLNAVLGHLRHHGYPLRVVPYLRWLEMLGAAAEQRQADETTSLHSVAMLDSLASTPAEGATAKVIGRANLERDLAESGLACPAINGSLLDRYLEFFTESGFLPTAESVAALTSPTAEPPDQDTPAEAAYWRQTLAGSGTAVRLGIDRAFSQAKPGGSGEIRELSSPGR